MKKKSNLKVKAVACILAAAMIFTVLPVLNVPAFTSSAAAITASGTVSDDGVNLINSVSTSASSVAVLKKGAKLTIYKEIFTEKSLAATARWYYVTSGKVSGYIRSDFVNSVTFSSTAAVATDALNYRSGPATNFKKIGTMAMGTLMYLQLPASFAGKNENWYRTLIGGRIVYVCGDYIKLGDSLFIKKTPKELEGKSDLAKALLTNPTGGGKARVVCTFNSSNCSRIFSIKGTKKAKVPQGMAFTGSEYYILYGMAAGQSIVTYSSSGKRLRASKFSFRIGHPNGIAWDPVTKLCYIFKGNTRRIYTWNPATRKYGKAKTPYSSSGAGYDNSTNSIYASSRSGIRAYSADGAFSHRRLFPRCSHGIFHYTQDCGAGGGFIFHCISGANKKKTNFIDIYRAEDFAYLGSVKVTLGEIESACVGNDGYLRILINTMGSNTDYVWKTPLNVNELK